MVVSIDRNNNNIFSPQTIDELNNSFFQINNLISEYKPEPLEYKSNIQYINNSNSFIAENILCIRESFVSQGVYDRFTKILELPKSVPYDVWCSAISEKSNFLTVHIKNKSVLVYGTSTPNEVFNIVIDVVLPN